MIVEDASSGRYVQFTVKEARRISYSFPIRFLAIGVGPEPPVLQYDPIVGVFPTEGVTEDTVLMESAEVERLRRVLEKSELHYSTVRMIGRDEVGTVWAYLEAIEGELSDPQRGEHFVKEVFEKVYLLTPPERFAIIEN